MIGLGDEPEKWSNGESGERLKVLPVTLIAFPQIV
jgi:hypothetical protein